MTRPKRTFRKVEDIEIRLLREALFHRYHYDFRSYAMSRCVDGCARRASISFFPPFPPCRSARCTIRPCCRSSCATSRCRSARCTAIPAISAPFAKRSSAPQDLSLPQGLGRRMHSAGVELYSFVILFREDGWRIARSSTPPTSIPSGWRRPCRRLRHRPHRLFTENHRLSGGRTSCRTIFTTGYNRCVFDKSLRANEVFSDHSIVTDQVFGEMHLVSCRNVMIYFRTARCKTAPSAFPRGPAAQRGLGLGSRKRCGFPCTRDPFAAYVPEEKIYQRTDP